MAAKKYDTTTAAWSPTRKIGLARALQKMGYGTRKTTESLIASGRVAIEQEVERDPGAPILPGQTVTVDGRLVTPVKYRYFAFHKPGRVVCTGGDGPGKRLVAEFLPRGVPGLRSAGRLDSKTTGLLLISNDPTWNNLVTVSSGLEQEYRVQVEGEMTELEIGVVTAGVHLPNLGLFRPLSVKIVEKMNGRTVILMVVREGKVRQLRRMFTTLRHKITLMRRVRIGEVRLGDLTTGGLRALTDGEVASMKERPPTIEPGEAPGA